MEVLLILSWFVVEQQTVLGVINGHVTKRHIIEVAYGMVMS